MAERREPGHEPQPLHRLERLGRTCRRPSSAEGIRFDTNYYYWPGSWVQDRPGLFTGSGFPKRFADTDGSLVDVYQAATQLTDESQQNIANEIAVLLDNATGAKGYYAVVTANMHTDTDKADHPGADAIIEAAQARGVPTCRPSRCSPGSTAATRRPSPACR